MRFDGKKIGVALTGSFCTYQKSFPQIKALTEEGGEVQTIFSDAAQEISSRFGSAESFLADRKSTPH